MENTDSGTDSPPLGKKLDRETLDERNFQVILNQVNDENQSYQTRAIESLGRIGDQRATGPLIDLLSRAEPEIAYVIVRALGKLRDPMAVDPLIRCLDSPDRWLRQGAAWALGEIGDPKAVEPLIGHLADSREKVRSEIAQAIGKLGDDDAVAGLERFIIGEDDPEVRHSARQAIKMIQGS